MEMMNRIKAGWMQVRYLVREEIEKRMKMGAKIACNLSFRTDGNSQETNRSSLTSTATRESNAEKKRGIMKNT